jgi:hypothetical protein
MPWPGCCWAKWITVVVPPNAADAVPVVKSSQPTVPCEGVSKWVWGSIMPGST